MYFFTGSWRRTIRQLLLIQLIAWTTQAIATAAVVIDDLVFHDATNTGIQGGSPDAGGAVFVFLRNTGSTTETFTQSTVSFNGQAASSYGSFDWSRVWPLTIAPGEVTTLTIKGNASPFVEGNTVTVGLTSNAGTAVSTTKQLSTPKLRIGNVIPSQDRRTSYVFLRNLDPVNSYNVNQLFLNQDVTSASTFVGGNQAIAPNSVRIIKVDHGAPLSLLTPLAVRVNATRVADSAPISVGAPVRLTEPILPTGAYSSNLSLDERVMEDVRLNYGHTISWLNGTSQFLQSRNDKYDLRAFNGGRLDFPSTGTNQWDTNTVVDPQTNQTAPVFSLPASTQAIANNSGIYSWYLSDEPDLNISKANRNPQGIWRLNETYWRNTNKPTYVNLASDSTVQRYGLITDHVSIDHYMQYAPLVYSSFSYPIDEALRYAESIKNNVEPLRTWSIAQGVSPGTWSKQPTDWGIAVQFWSAIMGGAKGITGFKYDAGDTMRTTYPTQLQRQVDLVHELQTVRNLVLYGEPINNVQVSASTNDMAARSLISEHAVVVPVVNLTGQYNVIGSTVSFSTLNNVNVQIPVPDWIQIGQVKEVTSNGFVDVNYTQNGQLITIPISTLRDSRVFVISELDQQAPDPITNLQSVARDPASEARPAGQAFVSWDEPFDNFGIQGYKLFQQGIEIANVKTPAYLLNFSIGAPLVPYYVRAYDAAGNLSSLSNMVLLPQFNFVTGDYNLNGVVDAADYIVWRKSRGQAGFNLPADGNGNFIVDDADYQVWRTNFGKTFSPASASAQFLEVPEPPSWCVLAVLTTMLLVRWR